MSAKLVLLGLASLFTHLASQVEDQAQVPPETDGDAAPKPRGRPRGSTNATTQEPAPAEKPTGLTLKELQALIQPLVDDGQGPAVKAVVKKYTDGIMKDIPSEKHADFKKDIEALII